MMSPDNQNLGRAKPKPKPTSSTAKAEEALMNSNNNHHHASKQPPSSASSSPSMIQEHHHHHQPQPNLNCPRCDSPNTKFCYYNNYSLTQPRHFCKTCRRYWTKGGALRNVPVGGGCRKNKKIKPSSSSSSSSRLFSSTAREGEGGDSFQGFLSPAAIDYQSFGGGSGSSLPAFSARTFYNNTTSNNRFPSFGDMVIHTNNNNSASNNNNDTSCFSIINDNNPSGGNPNLLGGGSLSMDFDNINNINNNVRGGSLSLTSSIESLSSINQDLHLKLQQQRMALLLGIGVGDQNQQQHHHRPDQVPISGFDDMMIGKRPNPVQPILFQDLETARAEFGDHHREEGSRAAGTTTATTEWLFDDGTNPYSLSLPAQQVRVATTATTNDPTVVDGNSQNWSNGIQAWSDLPQYNALH